MSALIQSKPRYSNSIEISKQLKNRQDNSDLDEHLTESIAAQTKFHLKKFVFCCIEDITVNEGSFCAIFILLVRGRDHLLLGFPFTYLFSFVILHFD